MNKLVEALVTDFFVPIAEVVLPVLAALALNEWRKWLKTQKFFKENDEMKYELDQLVDDAVRYAEEVAHKMARISGEKVPGDKKEELAVNALLESAKAHNLTAERARKLILTSLGNTRLYKRL